MVKTNTRKAKENIRNYIEKIYCGCECDYSNHDIKTDYTDLKNIKETIVKIFYLEYGNYQYNMRYGEYQAFKSWCQGLPSIIDTCYYYNRSAVKDLGDILEETEEERNQYTEEEAEELLTHLLYREIFL